MSAVTLEIPPGLIPEGWEPIGFREPRPYEPFITDAGVLFETGFSSSVLAPGPRLILKQKRVPKVGEVWKRADTGDLYLLARIPRPRSVPGYLAIHLDGSGAASWPSETVAEAAMGLVFERERI